VLALESDPRSPERGQYGFLQALVQRVAYETLSRHDRKAKHLRAAEFLAAESGMDPDEIAEVIAAHYLDAFHADESATDAAEIEGGALEWLTRAGGRASAQRHLRRHTMREGPSIRPARSHEIRGNGRGFSRGRAASHQMETSARWRSNGSTKRGSSSKRK